ncbi:MAG: hypothetical protein US54_C0013G0002 [Candidatus Roizmanbacteria bacterium GW2011_GWA2_37_7]|uniref:DUF433 domain-containing protein n=1 Tax=Candidatus Roizmanbacteria bacterium GW2011_GWA2_37_7 TaxID=1618481 RepID=A0A0G0JN64_9BACT|nr:MAG: hypothetical protein US54_C0013G0002 [Candidatus Roizmanbacteria bacterium GW2011_GWA2_37_7]
MMNIVEKNPKVLGGTPVMKGTRIPVSRIMALIGMDYKLVQLKKEFPRLKNFTKNDFEEMLHFYGSHI